MNTAVGQALVCVIFGAYMQRWAFAGETFAFSAADMKRRL